MNKIFLIIFVLQYIKADDEESVIKYIDLLPEEKKQEFLNRIARRISEAVSSPDIPNESRAEVNEDQLDAQNAYVNQIIKEESKNLDNEKRNELLSNDQETDNKKADKNIDDDPHIDLTLRTQSREERNADGLNEQLDVTRELKVIPVINNQENVKSHDNSAIKSETNVDIKAIPKNDISTELAIGKKYELSATNDSKSTENVNIIRKSNDDKLLFSTTISNYDPSSEENTLATEDEIVLSTSTTSPDNGNTTEKDDKIIWISTKNIFDSKSNENTNSESAETTSNSILTTLTDEDEVTTSSLSILTLETENSLQEITTSKTPDNKTRSKNTKTKLNKHLYVRSGDSDVKNVSNITQLTHNNLSDSKTNGNDTDPVAEIVNNTISELNITNSQDNKSNTSDVRSFYLVNKNKENGTDLKAKDSYISLRASYDSKESQIDTSQEDLKPNAKVYEVFEVAADKPPFEMKSNVEIKDTPYYVPVYNYAPNYAYFSPRSRFGPNADNKEEIHKEKYETYSDEDSPNIRSISGYNTKNKAFYVNKPGRYTLKNHNENIFDLIRPMKINHFQNIYYNPNDYLDMDYYFGRTSDNLLRNGEEEENHVEEGFPNTNEEDHPYNSIHTSDTIKDHIRAVRNLLYLKKIFEPIPEETKKQPRKSNNKRIQSKVIDTKYKERDDLRNDNHDNIAVDYYFGIEPNLKAAQGVTVDKPNKNKLLRYPGKNKGLKSNDKLNNLKNISRTNSIDIKLNTTVDIVMESMLDVLRDFIRFDNQALSRYNWLESTVDILAAIKKLLELMEQMQFQEHINPKDLELLKYVLYLYKSSVNTLKKETVERNLDIIKELNREAVEENETVKRNKGVLPKNKWNSRIRKPLKLWIDVASFIRRRMGGKEEPRDLKKERAKLFYDFEDFLQNLMFSLHDFHEAIKHIAVITRYNNQKWYEDLKNIYLQNASNEKLLTLLLHVSVTKLLNSIESSATNGVENNFKEYIIYNKQYVQRSKEEFLFVLNILHELRRLNKH